MNRRADWTRTPSRGQPQWNEFGIRPNYVPQQGAFDRERRSRQAYDDREARTDLLLTVFAETAVRTGSASAEYRILQGFLVRDLHATGRPQLLRSASAKLQESASAAIANKIRLVARSQMGQERKWQLPLAMSG